MDRQTGPDGVGYVPVEEASLLFRRLRHRFMNDIQVVYGWLQLDEPSRALDYLVACRDRFLSEGQVLRVLPETVSLPLMAADLELTDRGVVCRYEVDRNGFAQHLPYAFRSLSFGRAIQRLLLSLADILTRHGPGSTLDVEVRAPGPEQPGAWKLRFVGVIADNKTVRWAEWEGYSGLLELLDGFAGQDFPGPDAHLGPTGFELGFTVPSG